MVFIQVFAIFGIMVAFLYFFTREFTKLTLKYLFALLCLAVHFYQHEQTADQSRAG